MSRLSRRQPASARVVKTKSQTEGVVQAQVMAAMTEKTLR